MNYPRNILIPICVLATTPLWGFDARYQPGEGNVSWPAPEDESDKAAIIFQHPELGNLNLMTGMVAVDGDPDRPFIARLNDQGGVEWSKRLPLSVQELSENISVVDESHLIVAFQVEDNGVIVDRVGSFNPADGFSERFAKSLPALPGDPLDPLDTGRVFEAQRGGKVAMIETGDFEVRVLMLNESGNSLFARTYALPEGGNSGFPIPGLGISYDFANLTELSNGDYYLTTSGMDLINQTVKVVIIRLNSSGDILWQRIVDMPGTSAFVTPRKDEKVLITGNAFDMESVNSPIVLINENGGLGFAKTVDNALFNSFSFSHFDEVGNILLQGTIATELTEESFKADGAVLILSNTGDKVDETAYDLSDNDSIFHVGTVDGNLYFEMFGFDTDTGALTHGILAKADANLQNWTTRSYLDVVGPSAIFSAFFAGEGAPYLTYRDENQDWINVSKLDENLQETGECTVLADTTVVPYDPDLVVTSFSPAISESGVTASEWAEAPDLIDAPITLEDTPLTVEFVCGNSGSGDPQSPWEDVTPINDSGDKKTGIGWINDSGYPYVWHYGNGGWIFLLPGDAGDPVIFGWDYVNGFWFATASTWQGWYYNFQDTDWGNWN